MKKNYLALLTILVILLTACGAEEIEWTVKQAPVFKPEVASEMIIEAKKRGGSSNRFRNIWTFRDGTNGPWYY